MQEKSQLKRIKEQKQLETTQVTPSYKATVVLRWYVSGPKVMVASIAILNEAKHKTFYSQTKWSVPLKIALMNWFFETWTR